MKLLLAALLLTGCAAAPEPAYASREAAHRIEMLGGGVCSSTAVATRTLLSAAHCVKRDEKVLMVDGTMVGILRMEFDESDHVLIVVTKTFKHVAKRGPAVKQGDKVHMWGNPAGQPDIYREGIVAGKVNGNTAVDINGWMGDSGAAVWNERGELVGVFSAIASQQIFKLGILYPDKFTDKQWASIS